MQPKCNPANRYSKFRKANLSQNDLSDKKHIFLCFFLIRSLENNTSMITIKYNKKNKELQQNNTSGQFEPTKLIKNQDGNRYTNISFINLCNSSTQVLQNNFLSKTNQEKHLPNPISKSRTTITF